MFVHVNAYKQKLIRTLTLLNENMNWTDFIDKYIINSKIDYTNSSAADIKILKLIRSKLWTDKTIASIDSQLKNTRMHYMEYYINLMQKYKTLYPDIFKNKQINIVDINKNNELDLIEEFENDIKLKIDVLKTILSLSNLTFSLVNLDNIDKNAIVITTGSVSYKNIDKLQNITNMIIYDDYYNCCFDEYDNEYNKLILTIRGLIMSTNTEADMINHEYGMLKCKIHKLDK